MKKNMINPVSPPWPPGKFILCFLFYVVLTLTSSSQTWNLQYNYEVTGGNSGLYGVESDATSIYLTRATSSDIVKYTISGGYVETFTISSVSNLKDLAYDGTYFYGGKGTNAIYKMNFSTKALTSTITCPSNVIISCIAYDSGSSGFWVAGSATDIWLVNQSTGAIINTIPIATHTLYHMAGIAYDNWSPGGPYLWVFDNNGNGCNLVRLSLPSGVPSATIHDVTLDLSLSPYAYQAKGLFTKAGVVPGTVTLGGLCSGASEKIFGYELATTGTIYSTDVGVQYIQSPVSGFTLSGSETVQVRIRNYGYAAKTNIPVYYTVNSGVPVSATITDTIPAGGSYLFSFPQTVNMSALGKTYTINAYTSLTGDQLPSNNGTYSYVMHKTARNQTINMAEYFTGNDPGEGNGTSVQAGYNVADITTGIDSLYLTNGSIIYFRFRSSNGLWSNPLPYKKYLAYSNSGSVLVNAEYFINSDPGQGNGIQASLVNGTINLDNIAFSQGQIAYIRVKDNQNRWSDPMPYKKLKYFSNSNASLIQAEYYVNSDPGQGNATSVSIVGGIINIDSIPLVKGQVAYVRVKDDQNRWSDPMGYKKAENYGSSVVQAEYFINSDPGQGNGIQASLVNGTINLDNFAFSAGQTAYVRVKDNQNRWSDPMPYKKLKYFSNSNASLIQAEYYVNSDPGQGNASTVTIVGGVINVDSIPLIKGQVAYVRVKDDQNRWSDPIGYKKAENYGSSLVQAEYFINNDPGQGNGIQASLVNGTINLDNIAFSQGQTAYVRVKDSQNRWSDPMPYKKLKYFSNSNASLIQAEYFINTDPGQGIAIPVPIIGGIVSIDSISLTQGQVAYIRVKDDQYRWSEPVSYKKPCIISNTGASLIVCEYYINTDPGYGNGIPVNIVNGNIILDSIYLNANDVVYFRVKDSYNRWSDPAGYKSQSPNQNSGAVLVNGEYFINTDPGKGYGIPVSISSNGILNINSLSVNPGDVVYLRVRDNSFRWSFPRSVKIQQTFQNSGSTLVSGEYFIDTDPGVGNGIPVPVNNGIVNLDSINLIAGDVVYIRVLDNMNRWSFPRSIKIQSSYQNSGATLIAAEYFIDSDPGLGNGVPVLVNNGIVNLDSMNLITGNVVYVRVLDNMNRWSFPRSYKIPQILNNSGATLIAGEYFINTDPGNGNAIPVTINNGIINLNNLDLENGDVIYIRVKDSYNRWGPPKAMKYFFKGMQKAEYKIKYASTGQFSVPLLMDLSQAPDSGSTWIGTKNQLAYNTGDEVWVRFQTTEGIYSNWKKGVIANAGNDITLCSGNIATLTATGGSSYQWSNGMSGSSISFIPVNSGAYTVTVSDGAGAWSFDTVNVTLNQVPQPPAPISGLNSLFINPPNSVYQTAGSTGATSYTWNINPPSAGVFTGNDTSAVVDWNDTFTGTATLTVKGVNSCGSGSFSPAFTINIYPVPASIQVTPVITNVSCHGGNTGSISINLFGGTSPYSFNWSTGSTTNNISNLSAGAYKVTVTDIMNSMATGSFQVSQPEILQTDLIANEVSCYGADNGSITVEVTGGTSPYLYFWSNNINTQTITNLAAGTYSVAVIDQHSCISVTNTTIVEPQQILITTASSNDELGLCQGTASANVTGGTPPFSYFWNDASNQQNQTAVNLCEGQYSVIVTDNNGCTQSAYVNISNLSNLPWTIITTDTLHRIVIPSSVSIIISGVSVQTGDAIGVFYNQGNEPACGGYIIWSGLTDTLIAYGSQQGMDNGFQTGETFIWKVWKSSAQQELIAIPTYDMTNYPDSSTFIAGGLSGLLSLVASGLDSQVISLQAGWRMFSTYIIPSNQLLSNILSSVSGTYTLVKNNSGQVFWPQYGIDNIQYMVTGQGYQIRMTNSVYLTVTGIAVIPENTIINIYTGWNMIAYLRQTPGSIVNMLSSIYNQIIIVKNTAGFVYWPVYNVNNIGNLNPGEGYQIYMQSSVIFIYPPNTENSDKSELQLLIPSHYGCTMNTGNNMTLGVEIGEWRLENGVGRIDYGEMQYELGVFDNQGNLVGSGVLNEGFTAITIWGDDDLTPVKDGLLIGEKFIINTWNDISETESQMVVNNWVEGDDIYEPNKISIAGGITSFDLSGGQTILYQNIPNPFKQTTGISFYIPSETYVELSVYNMLGEKLETLISKEMEAGKHKIEFRSKDYPSGTYFYRMVTPKFVGTKVMNIMNSR